MTVFDPRAAAVAYAEKDTDELVIIAFLDPNFLPEAKDLALRELNKRGALKNKAAAIDRARRQMAYSAQAVEQAAYYSAEKTQRFNEKFREAAFIGAIWVLAFVGPSIITHHGFRPDWSTLVILAFWLFFVIDAIRNCRKSGRRSSIVYVVVVPVALFALGSVIQFVN